jgi:hypothetical protein
VGILQIEERLALQTPVVVAVAVDIFLQAAEAVADLV